MRRRRARDSWGSPRPRCVTRLTHRPGRADVASAKRRKPPPGGALWAAAGAATESGDMPMLTLADSLGWWTRRFQRTPGPEPAPAPAAPDTVRRTARTAERDPGRAARPPGRFTRRAMQER